MLRVIVDLTQAQAAGEKEPGEDDRTPSVLQWASLPNVFVVLVVQYLHLVTRKRRLEGYLCAEMGSKRQDVIMPGAPISLELIGENVRGRRVEQTTRPSAIRLDGSLRDVLFVPLAFYGSVSCLPKESISTKKNVQRAQGLTGFFRPCG